MSVKICSVRKGSKAWKKGIEAGDILKRVNGEEINDVLDYDFYMADSRVTLTVIGANGKEREVEIKKGEYDEIGLEFESYLMDAQKSCRNKCIFCFIDQLPRGMRESLYFKDDDSRLSFFYGNYITLTNLQDKDVERIIKMRISPVNISVHTMNPELRVKMMANLKAGESLKYLKRFADAGIKMNTQLVLCPGINDGEELRYSIEELAKLRPAVESIACVPVGLTKCREGLYEIEGYNKKTAGEVIDIIEEMGNNFYKESGDRLVYPADEFFIKAGRELPPDDYYGEYSQLENGVGMVSLLGYEFAVALEDEEERGIERKVTIATGKAAEPFIRELAEMAMAKFRGLKVEVKGIVNKFFGESITVAGLVTGCDLVEQLEGAELGEEILIPAAMLRSDERFLDDMTREEVEKKLKIGVRATQNDGAELLSAMIGVKE